MLAAPVQSRVLADAYDVVHDGDEVVAREGEPVRSWIGVAEGLVKVVGGAHNKHSVLYSSVPQGSWIGEGSVIKDELRRYEVVTLGPSRTVHIPRATFRWLLDTSMEFNHFIIDHLNARLGQFMAMVEIDRISDPAVRLAQAISGLFNPVLFPEGGPALRVSQKELGELAGITRQRANVAIQELRKDGLIRVQYGAIVVVDLPGLRAKHEVSGTG